MLDRIKRCLGGPAQARQRQVQRLTRANRAYRMLSDCNQAVVRATEEPAMLGEVCRVIVKVGGYRRAWVGLTEQDDAKSIRPAAQVGYSPGFLDTLDLTTPTTPHPTIEALRSGAPFIVRDILARPDYEPWHKDAVRSGYTALIALPLQAQDQLLGTLTIYATEAEAFDDEEVRLLTELADDLSYGMMALRTVVRRRGAEEALRRESELLRRVTETSPAGIVVLDREGQINFANARAEQVLGLTKDEISQLTYDAPEWRITDYDGGPFPSEELPFQKVMRTGRPASDVRHAIQWPDGRRVLLSINAAPLLDEVGQVEGMVATVEDVTAQVQAERALQESEERHRTISELTSDLAYSFRFEPDGTLVPEWVIGALSRVIGWTIEEIRARGGWTSLIHPDDLPVLLQRAQTVLSGPPDTGEIRVIDKQGETRWLRIYGRVVRAPGEVVRIIGAAQDITERKRAEEALRESEEKFRNIIESIPVGMHMYRLESEDRLVFTGANPAADEILGIDNGQFVGQTIEEAFPPLDELGVPEQYRRVALEGETWQTDQISYKDDRVMGAFQVHAFQTEPGEMVAAFLDITERVQAEEALRRAKREWEEIFEAIGHPTMILDPQHRILSINRAAIEAIDRPEKELVGQRCCGIFHKIDQPPASCPLEQMLLSGDLQTTEMEMEAVGRTFLVSCTPVFDDQGNLEKVIHVATDITERKQAENALQESEERFRKVFEQGPLGMGILNPDDRFIRANATLCRMVGYTEKELTGMTFADITHPEDVDDSHRLAGQLLRGEIPFIQTEKRYLTREGRTIWINLIATFVHDDEGNPLYKLTMIEDITERKRAEQDLRESEERFRSIFENAVMGLYRSTPDGRVLMANPAMLRMLGYSSFDELAERNLDQDGYASGFSRTAFKRRIEEEGQVVGLESVWVKRDGGTLFVRENARAIRDGAGNVKYYEGTVEDITERRRAEAEIARLQHLLQNITDSMPSALITLDPDGQILTWNPAARTLADQAGKELQGQSLWRAWPELIRYRDLFEQVVKEGQVIHRHKQQMSTKSGMTYHDVSVFPLKANDIEGVVVRIDDVTRRVQLEDMMLQSAKMASVGGLAAGMAHEINNPLGAMMQSAQVLHMALDMDRPRTRERLSTFGIDPENLGRYLRERGLVEYLEGIRNAGSRAAKIVTDLLSFSRKTTSDAAPHNLNELVRQALGLAATDYDLRKKYDFRNLEILYDLADNLPPVICDGQQIQQVVLNLVRNAAQAMAEKMGWKAEDYRPRLVLCTKVKEGWVQLKVQDNGPGIPERVQERLFEPFFTTKDVGEGTGLGLWLCWSIVVERHKGRIWHESVSGSGTSFVVELPLA